MEARLFPLTERGGFHSEEEALSWLNNLSSSGGAFYLTRLYKVLSNSIALFGWKGTIVGCAVVRDASRRTTEEEQHEVGEDWKAVMGLDPDPKNIWIWGSEQYVRLKEVEISFRPGIPMTLSAQQVLSIFRLVAERSGHRLG